MCSGLLVVLYCYLPRADRCFAGPSLIFHMVILLFISFVSNTWSNWCECLPRHSFINTYHNIPPCCSLISITLSTPSYPASSEVNTQVRTHGWLRVCDGYWLNVGFYFGSLLFIIAYCPDTIQVRWFIPMCSLMPKGQHVFDLDLCCRETAYNFDLTPSDIFLFRGTKVTLKVALSVERRLKTITAVLKAIPTSAYEVCFVTWERCWKHCVELHRDYWEGL